MTWIGFLFTLGIPLASLFFRIVVNLTGGYKIPLAWTFSYYSALIVAFTLAFNFAKINCKNKIRLAMFAIFVSVCLGAAIGLAAAKAGVLGHPWEDPSRGNVPLGDVITSAVMGVFSGWGLGLGNEKWVQVLASRGVNLNLALVICLSIAVFSIVIALGVALFFW